MNRKLFFYKNYFNAFFEKQEDEVKQKIDWTLTLISELEHIPQKFFKHIEGSNGLYEIRVQVGTNIFRIFSFFDKGNLIIVGNGYQKKSQKLSKKELKRAIGIKEEYESNKK